MRTLFWKEWRENRLIVLWAALLELVLMAAGYSLAIYDKDKSIVDSGSLLGTVYVTWVFGALFCSSSIVAPEIGVGTLQFMSSLPISRAKIWLTKVVASTFVLVLSIIASSAVCIGTCLAFDTVREIIPSQPGFQLSIPTISSDMLAVLVVLPVLFSIGATVTMLVDRPMSAFVISVLTSIALATIAVNISAQLVTLNVRWTAVAIASIIFVAAMLSVSFQTFVRGETLRTSARFKVAVPHILQSAAIIGAALVISFLWITLW